MKMPQKLKIMKHPAPGKREIMVSIGTELRAVRIYLTDVEALDLAYKLQSLARGQGDGIVRTIAEVPA